MKAPSQRLLMGLALGAVAILSALAVVLLAGLGGRSSGSTHEAEAAQMQATAALAPRAALFGDTITAWVDLTFDRKQFDPSRVRVSASFAPWTRVGSPTVAREDAGSTTFLHTSFTLRCLTIGCVPGSSTAHYQFRPAHVLYVGSDGKQTESLAVTASWPVLVVHSRLDALESQERDPLSAPWRADVVSLPAVTYRFPPGGLTAMLLGVGVALIALAGVIAYRARPRRVPPPAPPPPPTPVLAPLEKALRLLEAATAEGVDERRRSLELVADELALLGDGELEGLARRLAWSEEGPEPEETAELVVSVRSRLGERESGVPVLL
jgi:hypothetical protein